MNQSPRDQLFSTGTQSLPVNLRDFDGNAFGLAPADLTDRRRAGRKHHHIAETKIIVVAERLQHDINLAPTNNTELERPVILVAAIVIQQ